MTEHAATRTFSASHPALAGHFPGRPIVPGVVLLAWVESELAHALGGPVRISKVPGVKFLLPIEPGDACALRLRIGDGEHAEFRIVRGELLVASGTLRFCADAGAGTR